VSGDIPVVQKMRLQPILRSELLANNTVPPMVRLAPCGALSTMLLTTQIGSKLKCSRLPLLLLLLSVFLRTRSKTDTTVTYVKG
jgi:hypothetical protein